MPRLIDPGSGDAIGVDELIGALDQSDFDVRDEDSFAALGPLLARLGRNRDFLTDRAIDILKARRDDSAAGGANVYGGQVLLLSVPNGRYVLRANFWPAANDAVVRSSGMAPFFYGVPHDHNFPFLTVGYLGPGYASDYYDVDAASLTGLPDEPAGLRFVERSTLSPGKLMLYRAHRDVHAQLPPDRFSVSLNILGYDIAQPWRTQWRFDIGRDCIAEALTTTPSEALAALAVHFGGGNGIDLAHQLARRHPVPRMRVTALKAIASTLPDDAARIDLFAHASADADAYVACHAARLARSIEGNAQI